MFISASERVVIDRFSEISTRYYRTSKHLYEVFQAMAIVTIYNPYSRVAQDFKKEYFSDVSNHYLVNGLLLAMFPKTLNVSANQVTKALKIVDNHINLMKKYA